MGGEGWQREGAEGQTHPLPLPAEFAVPLQGYKMVRCTDFQTASKGDMRKVGKRDEVRPQNPSRDQEHLGESWGCWRTPVHFPPDDFFLPIKREKAGVWVKN